MDKMTTGRDYIGLSTEPKPLNGVRNGETYYEVDTKNAYIFYKGQWYQI